MTFIRPITYAEFLHPISRYVAPLCGFSGQRAFVGGTAVIIAPGLAITASHVLDEIQTQFGYDRSSKNIELDIYVNQLSTGACWYVCHASSWVGTDITVLSLKARNDVARSASVDQLPIAVDPPTVDTKVTALGYPGTGLTIPRNDRDVLKMNFTITPTVSEGKVIEIHRSLRDTACLRFPCFAVNPGGHLKLPHLWPGQIPPPPATRQGDFIRLNRAWQCARQPPLGASSCPRT